MDNGGYIELTSGVYVGELSIDGVNISPIVGYFFKDKGTQWLWIKRKRILEYDIESGQYLTKNPTPQFEAYLKKQGIGKNVAYQGNFVFFKFKYTMSALWDTNGKKTKLNLCVERLPMKEQNILNTIKKNNNER